uniref:Tectonic domain-containing protein n=1 Tax=Anopheles minimus TaxID=112268 RepID=A0A182W214_9DIPT
MFELQIWKLSLFPLFCTLLLASSNRPYKVIPIVTDVKLQDNLNYLNSSASTRITPTDNKIGFAITVKKPLIEPWVSDSKYQTNCFVTQNAPSYHCQLNMVLWVDVVAGVVKAPMQNLTIDFCKFLRNPAMYRLLQIIHREVKRSGNVPTGCPISTGLYEFRDISTSTIRLPLFFPESNYVLHILLMPVLTKATVEGSKYLNTSVAINRHGALQNFTMELVVHVLLPLDDLKMNMGYYVRLRDSDNWIYNKTYDFCAFLKRPSIDRFGSIVVEDLKHRGKVPPRCPIMPERLVYRNVTLNRIKLPSFLPETSFGFTVNCYKGPKNEPVFQSYWYGRMRKIVPMLSKMELTGSKYCNATGGLRITRTNSFMDLHLDILERVPEAKMNTGYFIRTTSTENWIYNKTFDFCQFLIRPTIDRLMNLIREDLRHHGRMPARCPVEKGPISFTNSSLSYMRLPSFLPPSKFGVVIQTYTGKQMHRIFRAVLLGKLKTVNE